MNKKIRPPKPEMPMPQGGQMPEVMGAIMPDFPRWNRLFFLLDCGFALLSLLVTSIFFAAFRQGELLDSPTEYLLLHIILPSAVNAGILLRANGRGLCLFIAFPRR